MDPPLSLERFAALSAEIEAGSPRDEVLAREGIAPDGWAEIHDAWMARIAEDMGRGSFELTNRYNAAFVARRASLRYGGGGPSGSAGGVAGAGGAGGMSNAGAREAARSTVDDSAAPVADRMTPIPRTPRMVGAPEHPPGADAGGGRLAARSATPFIAVESAPPRPIEDAPTPPSSTRDPETAMRASAEYGLAPVTPAMEPRGMMIVDEETPPSQAVPSWDQDGPNLHGLPFKPAPAAAETTPRTPAADLPDVLPFRPAAGAHATWTGQAPASVRGGLPFRSAELEGGAPPAGSPSQTGTLPGAGEETVGVPDSFRPSTPGELAPGAVTPTPPPLAPSASVLPFGPPATPEPAAAQTEWEQAQAAQAAWEAGSVAAPQAAWEAGSAAAPQAVWDAGAAAPQAAWDESSAAAPQAAWEVGSAAAPQAAWEAAPAAAPQAPWDPAAAAQSPWEAAPAPQPPWDPAAAAQPPWEAAPALQPPWEAAPPLESPPTHLTGPGVLAPPPGAFPFATRGRPRADAPGAPAPFPFASGAALPAPTIVAAPAQTPAQAPADTNVPPFGPVGAKQTLPPSLGITRPVVPFQPASDAPQPQAQAFPQAAQQPAYAGAAAAGGASAYPGAAGAPAPPACGAFPQAPVYSAAMSAAQASPQAAAPQPPQAQQTAPALAMPAVLGASTSRLTLEQFASLSAEIAVSPGSSAAVRARYGLDETLHVAETGLWQRRFSADKDLFTRYSDLFQRYREWFSRSAR